MSIKEIRKTTSKIIILCLIFIFLILFFLYMCIFFAEKISPDSVIPDSFTVYMHIPNVIQMADKLIAHKPFYDILSNPRIVSILEKNWVRTAGKGVLDGALYSDGEFLAAMDIGTAPHLILFFSSRIKKLAIPNLRYVKEGKRSGFEYSLAGGNVIFLQPYKNLLIISNSSNLLETVLDKKNRNNETSKEEMFLSHDFDAGFLVKSEAIISGLSGSNSTTDAFFKQLKFSEFFEAALLLFPEKIDVSIASTISSDNANINELVSRDSKTTMLLQHLPANIQYSTVFSFGSVEELLNTTLSVYKQKIPISLKRIDATARMFFGVGFDDLLFAWTGEEMAVLEIEGGFSPVFTVQISNEQKRKEIFEKYFTSSIVDNKAVRLENGAVVPQAKIPGFLNMILNMWNIKISAPYYVVQNGFLFLSEDPDAIVSVINSIRKNDLLPKTELWQSLLKSGSDKSSLVQFYSLDHATPFFIKDNDIFKDALKLYSQGLIWVKITDGVVAADLSLR